MPLRRRLVSEETMDITMNSEVAQVLGRILMLPLAVLKEILKYLDTKLLYHKPWVGMGAGFWVGEWTGTQRMQNSLQLRRRVGVRQGGEFTTGFLRIWTS